MVHLIFTFLQIIHPLIILHTHSEGTYKEKKLDRRNTEKQMKPIKHFHFYVSID